MSSTDREPEALLRLLVASVKDYAIFMLDPSGRIATWNAGAQRFKGYQAEEIIGRHFSVFYPEGDIQAGKCEMELEVAARDGRFEDEGWRVRKDGSRFWANVVITAVHDERGHLVGFGKVTRDLTDRKRAEDDRAARIAAEEANRTKDHFLAMIGHELRNPLAPISTALQLMRLRGDDRSIREVQVIERQLKQMHRLVDDLLDASRVGRGQLELRRGDVDLRDVLARAAETVVPRIEKKGQTLEIAVPDGALHVPGDDARLVQVFSNLLDNASKYTHGGGAIAVSVRRDGGTVQVAIRDNGRGISAELLPRVFELFVQAAATPERTDGGLGLGLTLVRALVALHGGEVTVRSDGLGTGSTFVVSLPTSGEALAQVPEQGKVIGGPAHRTILVVDDNEDARELLVDVLAQLGHTARGASSGEDALRVLDAFTAEIAIVDISLPGMDGYELAGKIRARCPTTELIAVSGFGSDVEKSRDAGFAAHMVKPVGIQRLLEQIGVRA